MLLGNRFQFQLDIMAYYVLVGHQSFGWHSPLAFGWHSPLTDLFLILPGCFSWKKNIQLMSIPDQIRSTLVTVLESSFFDGLDFIVC